MRAGAFVSSITLAVAVLSTAACNKKAIDAQKLAKDAQSAAGEDPKGATEKYKEASRMDPTNHKILEALATLYEKQKDWPNAAETWKSAGDLADDWGKYHFHRGYSLYEAARKEGQKAGYEKPIDPFKKAVERDKNISDAHYYMGKCFYELDDEQGALEAYTKAIQTKGDQLHYYVDLANLYLDLGYAENGLSVALEGLKVAPQIKVKDENEKLELSNNWYNLVLDEARAHEAMGSADKKIEALTRARDVPNPRGLGRESDYQLALALFDQGKGGDACQSLARYLKSPKGKGAEADENRKDADSKKFQWKCPGS